MILDDFLCLGCACREERFHRRGQDHVRCMFCSTDEVTVLMKKLPPHLQAGKNFGVTGVHHTPGRRLGKAEAERREWYRETRHGVKQADPSKPKVFS